MTKYLSRTNREGGGWHLFAAAAVEDTGITYTFATGEAYCGFVPDGEHEVWDISAESSQPWIRRFAYAHDPMSPLAAGATATDSFRARLICPDCAAIVATERFVDPEWVADYRRRVSRADE